MDVVSHMESATTLMVKPRSSVYIDLSLCVCIHLSSLCVICGMCVCSSVLCVCVCVCVCACVCVCVVRWMYPTEIYLKMPKPVPVSTYVHKEYESLRVYYPACFAHSFFLS